MKQGKVTLKSGKIVKIYIVYEISKRINISNYPKLENCLFEAVTLTKNGVIDKSKYFGYLIVFDKHGRFSFPSAGLGKS